MVCLLCAGCYTKPMWDDATRKTLSRPAICGSLPASATDGGASRWLIRYGTRSREGEMFAIHILPDQEFYFVLATGGDGVPGSPFRYESPQRQWSQIDEAVSSAQHQEVEAERLAPISREEARKLMARDDFVDAGAMRLHKFDRGYGRGVWAYATSTSAHTSDSPLVPTTGETAEERYQATTNPTLASESVIVLLPSRQPRTDGNRYKTMVGATLLTPATVVVDGVTLVVVGAVAIVMSAFNIF